MFIGVDNGTVYSLDASSGCMYWSYKAEAGVRTAISVGPKLVYFGDTSANVVALDASRFRTRTGWAPKMTLERSLADTLEHWRSVTARAVVPAR